MSPHKNSKIFQSKKTTPHKAATTIPKGKSALNIPKRKSALEAFVGKVTGDKQMLEVKCVRLSKSNRAGTVSRENAEWNCYFGFQCLFALTDLSGESDRWSKLFLYGRIRGSILEDETNPAAGVDVGPSYALAPFFDRADGNNPEECFQKWEADYQAKLRELDIDGGDSAPEPALSFLWTKAFKTQN